MDFEHIEAILGEDRTQAVLALVLDRATPPAKEGGTCAETSAMLELLAATIARLVMRDTKLTSSATPETMANDVMQRILHLVRAMQHIEARPAHAQRVH